MSISCHPAPQHPTVIVSASPSKETQESPGRATSIIGSASDGAFLLTAAYKQRFCWFPYTTVSLQLLPQTINQDAISVCHSLFRMPGSTGENSAHLLFVCTDSPSPVTPLRKLTLYMQGLKQAHLRVSSFSERHLLRSGAQHGNPVSRKEQPKETEGVCELGCVLCCKPLRCTHTLLGLSPQLIKPFSLPTIKAEQNQRSQEQARGPHLCGVPEDGKEALPDLPHQLQTRAQLLCLQELNRGAQVLVLQQAFLCNSRPTESCYCPTTKLLLSDYSWKC